MYGLHGSIVELKNGSLMGLTRNSRIQNKMAKSISRDNGKTWTYSPSGLQVVGGAQRNAFIRLKEGPLFYAGFANLWIPVKDRNGKVSRGIGLFAALSYDEGKTWPVARQLWTGPSAYSCLTVLPDLTIGCLYEAGKSHAYETIRFARFSLAWLTHGKDQIRRDP